MSRENVEVVRRMYDGLNRGVGADALSDEVLATTFDPEIVLEQLAQLAGTAGTFRGYAGLRAADREVRGVLTDNRWEVLELAASGNKVGCVVRASGLGRASGVPVDLVVGHLFELSEGRIVRWLTYPDAHEALEAVGLSE